MWRTATSTERCGCAPLAPPRHGSPGPARTARIRLGLDAGVLLATVARQRAVETAPATILEITAPTEAATALAFRQTALVAGRPGNADALAEAGRLFGRLAHLIDAVEDLFDDRAAGAWNPIDALDLAPLEVRRLCDDALLGIRLALRDVEFDDSRLVHLLLVHELKSAVDRAFAGQPTASWTPPQPTTWQPPDNRQKRGALRGCLGWLVVCGTCQVCCASQYEDPCTGQPRSGACRGSNCVDCCDCSGCDCDCCDCCDGCDCCNC